MKYIIASDIHGSSACCLRFEEAVHREAPDRIILLGDLLYHGPRNALPDGYDTGSVIGILNALADRIICVRGNCDSEVDQMVLDFPLQADCAYLQEGGRLFFLTHGHLYGRYDPPALGEGDVLVCGHTHVPACEVFGNGNIYVNPGSVSIPKGGSVCSYMTLEDGVMNWKDLDGKTYMTRELGRLA